MLRIGVSLLLCVICLADSSKLAAQVTEYSGQTPGGAFYRIAVPADWRPSAGLVIWNHGYQGYTASGPDPSPSLGPLENAVLADGFALAASSYRQTGWAVFDSHLDNQQLYDRFVDLVGRPEQVYLQGASLGGIVTIRDLEAGLIPDLRGALLMCGASAGARNWYNAFDLRLIYAAVCSDVNNGELPTDAWHEIPQLVSGELQFLESLERCTGLISNRFFDSAIVSLLQTPAQAERLEKISGITAVDPSFLPLVLGYAVFELPRLVNDAQKLNGNRPFANTGIDYGDPVINRLVQRQAALPSARRLLLENYTPDGEVGDARIVTIHTSGDGLVPVANQQYFANLLSDEVITAAVVVEEEPSHCGFNLAEGLSAWQQLLSWTRGGTQPTVADLQQHCLQLADSPSQCRYDSDFASGDDPLVFPREARVASQSAVSFNSGSGQLLIESIKIAGEDPLYQVVLQQNAGDGLRFDLGSVATLGNDQDWQHLGRYFPTESLLYLPDLQLVPAGSGNNRFDVYFGYYYDTGEEWLQVLEFEDSALP
jgi:hypothetical protein